MSRANNPSPGRAIRKTTSKTQIVLDAIRFRNGMTYREIQQLFVLMAGRKWDPRENRGYASDRIRDLHEEFLVKGPDRKYRVRGKDERQLLAEDLLRSPKFVARYEEERRRMVREGNVAPPTLDRAKVEVQGRRRNGCWHAVIRSTRGATLGMEVRAHEIMEAAGN